MTVQRILKPGLEGGREDHWIPLADLMAGLMMMFMLVAILFMVKVQADAAKAKQVAVVYDQLRNNLYKDLRKEFEHDLPSWGATLYPDLSVRFEEPSILFDVGQDSLKPKFKFILTDFFPRYMRILSSSKYRSSIEEIRIEGHTSSAWSGAQSADDAYFENMQLSQARTRTTLKYVLQLSEVGENADWLKAHVTAIGLSSSRLVKSGGVEDAAASQRVEFRVRTNADSRLKKILETSGS